MVDIPRKSQANFRLIRRILYGVIALSALSFAAWYVSRMKPAAPSIERATILIDTVKRGPMLRQVTGLGKLVPEEIRWVPSATEGRVERKLLEAGAHVHSDTILVELSNQELEQKTTDAEWEWKAAETSYEDLKVKLESQQLNQEADTAQVESNYQQAVLNYDASLELARDGLVSGLDLKLKKVAADQLGNRLAIEKKRFEINKESISAQLANQRTRIDQAKAIYLLRKRQLDQLKVRAGVEGVLQEIPVDVGQRVAQGTNLARVANPAKLKAELNVPETQVKDIEVGQEASIDTRNGIISGRVSRIDPAVKNGSVTIDVRLGLNLPQGARPDLSVDGAIVLEKLREVVYVGRPVQGHPDSQASIFKLDPDGNGAVRVTVKLGRSSVNTIEVKEGLKPGDQVILSDMTAQDGLDIIRLN
jgi:HlyD family secretion protein